MHSLTQKIINKIFNTANPVAVYKKINFIINSSKKLKDRKPKFIIYYGDIEGKFHFQIWDKVFKKLDIEYISIFRHEDSWFNCHKQKNNVLAVISLFQVHEIIRKYPSIKAVFYPANNGNNIQIIRETQLNHIFIGHGDSDKNSSANKVFRMYDEIWVAGEENIARFGKLSKGITFKKIGQPWHTLYPSKQQTNDNLFAYLPTWQGYYDDSDYSSLPIANQILQTVQHTATSLRGAVKAHPRISQKKLSSLTSENIEVYPCQMDLTNFLKTTNPAFIVSDISASVSEALYLGKPIFVYIPKFIKSNLPLSSYCYTFRSIEELDALITTVIHQKNDYLSKSRKEAQEYVLGLSYLENDCFKKNCLGLIK